MKGQPWTSGNSPAAIRTQTWQNKFGAESRRLRLKLAPSLVLTTMAGSRLLFLHRLAVCFPLLNPANMSLSDIVLVKTRDDAKPNSSSECDHSDTGLGATTTGRSPVTFEVHCCSLKWSHRWKWAIAAARYSATDMSRL